MGRYRQAWVSSVRGVSGEDRRGLLVRTRLHHYCLKGPSHEAEAGRPAADRPSLPWPLVPLPPLAPAVALPVSMMVFVVVGASYLYNYHHYHYYYCSFVL